MDPPFPDLDDPAFATKLGLGPDLVGSLEGQTHESLCGGDASPFSLLSYQRLLTRFMSPVTPYRGLLIFAGTGAGKSAAVIAIAEGLKPELQRHGRRVLVLYASRAVEENFRHALHDSGKEAAERRAGLLPGALQAAGAAYYVPEGTPAREEAIRRAYEAYYEFTGDEPFTASVWAAVQSSQRHGGQAALAKAIRDAYSDRLIVVDEAHNVKDRHGREFSTYDALMTVLRHARGTRLVLMSATPMYHEAAEIVATLNLFLANDRRPELVREHVFEADGLTPRPGGLEALRRCARPYVSYVRGYNPLSFPRVAEVRPGSKSNPTYIPQPRLDINGEPLAPGERVRHTPLIRCPMSALHFRTYLDAVEGGGRNVAHRDEQDVCGVVFPGAPGSAVGMPGAAGFDAAFRPAPGKGFRYRAHAKGFLAPARLATHSCKYARVVANVLASPGIAFVSCAGAQIKTGVYTLAMALDEAGYERLGGGTLLQDHSAAPGDKVCATCNVRRRDHAAAGHAFRQARYVILQGQEARGHNQELVDAVNRASNRRGEEVKAVLGTDVAMEAVHLANVRQVHVSTAWHNLSRIAQVIGRGVRNCSHRLLPPEDRVVAVFRYCASPPAQRPIRDQAWQRETADENFWRRAEARDVAIKRVERVLKEAAFDCAPNAALNRLPGDADGSRECEYGPCALTCDAPASRTLNPALALLGPDANAVSVAKARMVPAFAQRTVWTTDELAAVAGGAGYAAWVALDDLVTRPEPLRGPAGTLGYVVYASPGYYAFQPLSQRDRRVPAVLRTPRPAAGPAFVRLALETSPSPPPSSSSQSSSQPVEALVALLDKLADPGRQSAYIDDHVSPETRVRLLEHLSELPESAHLLRHFRSFLLFDAAGRVAGHFLGRVPRCRDGKGAWASCGLEQARAVDAARQAQFEAPEAPYVGYVERTAAGRAFKVIDNSRQLAKRRLDLRVAVNTLTRGKRCETYGAQLLSAVAASLGEPVGGSKRLLCSAVELALRRRQLAGGPLRWFYSASEWEARAGNDLPAKGT